MFHFIPGINRPAGFFLLRSIKGYVARIACISFQDQIAGRVSRNAWFAIPRTSLRRGEKEGGRK